MMSPLTLATISSTTRTSDARPILTSAKTPALSRNCISNYYLPNVVQASLWPVGPGVTDGQQGQAPRSAWYARVDSNHRPFAPEANAAVLSLTFGSAEGCFATPKPR